MRETRQGRHYNDVGESHAPKVPGTALVKAGDRVELRPPVEILASLDDQARLEGVPFMPEMLQCFGKAYAVSARVERACDTVCNTGARRLPGTVMLEDLRCDGSGHAGCQAECRIYWKEAWLRSVTGQTSADVTTDPAYDELVRRVAAGAVAAESTPASACSAARRRSCSEAASLSAGGALAHSSAS